MRAHARNCYAGAVTDTPAVRAWRALLRAHAAHVPGIDATLQQQSGLPLGWYDVLLELNSAGGRLTMSALGERVTLSRTRVSRVVDELVSAGLVLREANPDDRRSSFAVLTADGKRRFAAAARVYLHEIEQRMTKVASDKELTALAESLERLLD